MMRLRPCLVLCVLELAVVPAFGQAPPEAPPLEGGSPVPAEAPAPEQAAPPPASGSSEVAGGTPTSAVAAPAATAPAATSPVPHAPIETEAEEPDSPPPPDHDAVFRAFAVYAGSERDRRIVGALAGVAAGATTMILGATLAEPTGTDTTVWYVVGGVTAGLSLLGLVFPSPAEAMARSFRVSESGHSASEARSLEIRWNDYALAARRRRITGGAVSLLVSAVAVGGGAAIATGAGDFTESDRYFWSTFLIASGATVGVTGLVSLFVKSSAERSFEAYRAVRPEATAIVPLLGAGPGGAFVGARGTF